MKWSFYSSTATILLTILSPCSLAESLLSKTNLDSSGRWFLNLGVGGQYPSWPHAMKVANNSGLAAPYDYDLYAIKEQSNVIFNLATGRRWQRGTHWLPYYSFSVFWEYLPHINLGGTIAQYTPSELTHARYDWKLKANLLLISAKANLFEYGRLSPYLNGGIGTSFNRTSGYVEKPLSNLAPRVSPNFASFNTSEFSYHFGAGLDISLSEKMIASVGYNYQNLGQVSSGPGKALWSNQSLNPGYYHSNEFIISATYFFDQ